MDILRKLYSHIWSLHDWLVEVVRDNHISGQLMNNSDSTLYKDLLKTTLVACQREELPTFNNFSQVTEQKELLSHVIQKLKRRNEKNILTLGYTMASDDIAAQVSYDYNLEIYCPNSSVNRLQKPVWSKLLSRVGDSVMEYLLENMSMFMAVPNANYIQLTGIPVYELWPMQSGNMNIQQKSPNKIKGCKRKKRSRLIGKNKKLRHNGDQTDTALNRMECEANCLPFSTKTSKKKKKKSACPEFSPYNFHTNISRIQILYARNLREKFSNNYILNVIPQTEDGALTLYRHVFEHKKAVYTPKAQIIWQFPENIENSMCDDSYCSAQTKSFDKSVDEDVENHSSFFSSGHYFDKVYTKVEEIQRSDLNRIQQEQTLMAIHGLDANEIHKNDAELEVIVDSTSCREKNGDNCSEPSHVMPQNGNICPEKHDSQGIETSGDDHSVSDSQGFETSENWCSLAQSQRLEINSSVGNYVDESLPQPVSINKCFNTQSISSSLTLKKNKELNVFQTSVNSEQNSSFTKIKSPDHFSSTPLDDRIIDSHINISCGTEQYKISVLPSRKLDNGGEDTERTKGKSLKRKQTDPEDIYPERKKHCLETVVRSESEEQYNMDTEQWKEALSYKNMNAHTDIQYSLNEEVTVSKRMITQCRKTIGNTLSQVQDVSDMMPKANMDEPIVTCGRVSSTELIMIAKGHVENISSEVRNHTVPEEITMIPVPVKETDKQDLQMETCVITTTTDGVRDSDNSNCISVDVHFIPELRTLLQQMVRNHRKCPYKVLLDFHCPVKKAQRRNQVFRRGQRYFGDIQLMKKTSVRENLHNFIPHRQVYLFIRGICLKVIPEEVFGTRSNRNNFCRNLQKIVNLNKYDKFCVGQLMSAVKVKDIPWLKRIESNSVRQHIVAKLWHWIVEEFILSVISAFFYVTDTTQHVNHLFYYRKKTWHWLHIKALSDLMKRNILKPISKTTAEQLISDRQSLGVASIRFFPKNKGLRPIINLGRQQTEFGLPSLPINKKLLNMLQVLTSIKKNHPEIVGAAKFGLDEVYKAWKEFSVKQSHRLFFVKTDISSCYDEILQHKLFSIIRGIFLNPEIVSNDFIIRRYVKLVSEGGIIKRKFVRKAFQLGHNQSDFILFIKQQCREDGTHDVIFVDQVLTQRETREQLLRQLHCHVFHNIIRIGQLYYQQNKGISQGSVISTLLCNIYYGEIEKLFPLEDGELMMRIVDDALFVTPSRERAMEYCTKMINGLPDFNFSINRNKVQTNFCIPELGDDITVLKNTDWLSWCGILLNMRTLEASVNLSFYCRSYLADTMTFDTTYNAGITVKRKLFRSLRLKCHPLYLDTEINSINVVVINIYKTLLLSAYKFTHYVRSLPKRDNYLFLLGIIADLGHYFYTTYRRVIKEKVIGECKKKLELCHIQWLCFHAFIMKLNQHRSQFKPVISSLQQQKIQLVKKLTTDELTADQLEKICGHRLLNDFQDRIL